MAIAPPATLNLDAGNPIPRCEMYYTMLLFARMAVTAGWKVTSRGNYRAGAWSRASFKLWAKMDKMTHVS